MSLCIKILTHPLLSIAIAACIALARISGCKSETFQAMSHLFVGSELRAAFIYFRKARSARVASPCFDLFLAVGLSQIELVAFGWTQPYMVQCVMSFLILVLGIFMVWYTKKYCGPYND